MAASSKNYSYEDYTVAWICALPLELAAAQTMLDETHPQLPAKANDDNSYTLGRIYPHNVVLACLPFGICGTTSATAVATQMKSAFKSIRFFLMVGIGGGAPTENNDVRLGDVVVSKPTRDLGGVIQYDYGKANSGGQFQRDGALNKPPPVLLTAIAALQAAHYQEPSKISSFISEKTARNPVKRKTFARPDVSQDLLFDHQYDHPGSEKTCSNCDKRHLIKRPSRTGHEPSIHYGLIASGNQVVKDSRFRDKLARELGIICFEMEAAGLMDNFPCLVIRGICDYSDSHKNKQWQNYAAITASAYAKELLSVVHANYLVDTPLADWDLSRYRGNIPYQMNYSTSVIVHESLGDSLLERISTYDHKRIHLRLSTKLLIGTAQWFLDHPYFKAWLNENTISTLWCSGKIGSGKTMIAAKVINHIKYCFPRGDFPVLFFYCDQEHHGALDESYIISSFVKQYCEFLKQSSRTFPRDIARSLKNFFGPDRIQPDLNDIQDIFIQLFHAVPDTIYIIDGIDALNKEHAKSLLSFIKSMFCSSNSPQGSRVLLLSRDQVPGYININTFIPGICRISTSTNITQDIKMYIETSISDKMTQRTLTSDSAVLDYIKRILLSESTDMFLWVHLQLEIIWDTCYTDAEVRSALAALPKNLEETYGRCIDRINFQDTRVLKVLKWVSFATRPLHIEELIEAVAFEPTDTTWNKEKKPLSGFVIGCCANLVVLDPIDNCVRFAHSSVKQYLENNQIKTSEAGFISGYPTSEQGNLECGEFCVAYLSFSDFSLQLSRTVETMVPSPSPILLAREAYNSGFLGEIINFFLQPSQSPASPVVLPFRTIRTRSSPNRTQYSFLNYAIDNWAPQTKQITRTSAVWEQFRQLAICFNETWNFHPWVSGGRSRESHIHGIFGWAVKEQHVPLLLIVQDAGSSLQRVCDLPLVGESLPALHLASKLGYKSIVEILLSFCDVNQLDQHKCTALHHAASKGHVEICELLLHKKGVKVDVESELQSTPLWIAAHYGHKKVVSLLIERRPNLEIRHTTLQRTPLSCAVEHRDYEIAEILLEKGAHIECQDSSGRTPLMDAITNTDGEMIQLLLEHGAKLDYEDIDGSALLRWATINGHERIAKLLVKKIASYDIQYLLLLAIENFQIAIARLFLHQGAKPDAYGDNKKPLLIATENSLTEMVSLLLQNGAEPDAYNNDQKPLLVATENGHIEIAKLLLENGAEPDIYSDDKQPLLAAAKNGHTAIAKLLLQNGAKCNADSIERNPISVAASNGHKDTVMLLLQQGSNYDSHYLLAWATRNGHEAVLRLLLDKGATYNTRDMLSLATENGHDKVIELYLEDYTASNSQEILSWAIENNYKKVLKLLLEKFSDNDKQNLLLSSTESGHNVAVKLLLEMVSKYNGQQLLFSATNNGHREVVRMLVRKITNYNFRELLILATEKGHTEVVDLLLEKDSSCDPRVLLLLATENGHEETVKLLLEKYENYSGQELLLLAIEKGHEAVVRLLLEKHADPNVRDGQGLTPLYWAVRYKRGEITKLLLEKEAVPNIKDTQDKTPLYWAVRFRNEGVVKLLLEKNADPDLGDREGMTPLYWATAFNHIGIMKLLLDKGADPTIKNS